MRQRPRHVECPTCGLHVHGSEDIMWSGARRLWDRCYHCGTVLTKGWDPPAFVVPASPRGHARRPRGPRNHRRKIALAPPPTVAERAEPGQSTLPARLTLVGAP